VEALLRRAILAAAANPRVRRLVRRHGMRLGAARFVAGETLDAAVPVLRRLNDRGLVANTTLLGEGVADRAETEAVVAAYEHVLDRIAAERLGCNLALKLTHLGLDEPPEVAYPRKAGVDAAYARLVERAFAGGAHTAVATHDERLIEHALALPAPAGGFELQMLYGVRPKLQLDLARRGLTVRVATPYGPEWYPYLMRRLAERPANALFLFRNLMKG
jgi:proline dehydrogenase